MDFNIGDLVLYSGKEAIIKGFHKNRDSCVIEFLDGDGVHNGEINEYWYEKDQKTPIPFENSEICNRYYSSLKNLKPLSKEPQYEVY